MQIKIISFSPCGITKLYMDRIIKDMPDATVSKLMQKLISEYFLLHYGKEIRDEIRSKFMEDYFDE